MAIVTGARAACSRGKDKVGGEDKPLSSAAGMGGAEDQPGVVSERVQQTDRSRCSTERRIDLKGIFGFLLNGHVVRQRQVCLYER